MPETFAEHKSVIFSWSGKEFHDLLRSCEKDEVTPYILRYLPKDGKTIEAGCGLGRFVKYLTDQGYDIEGIEYNPEAVRTIRRLAPELSVLEGNILSLPYRDESLAGMISLGVLEHFQAGMEEPLREIRRVLKPGGILIISVPSQNRVRRIKKDLFLVELNRYLNPISVAKRNGFIRRLFGRKTMPRGSSYNRFRRGRYEIYPMYGDFFEYRLRKEEFEEVLQMHGFGILESVPVGHMDGVFHEFGTLFVKFHGWAFHPGFAGRLLNRLLSRYPFAHNHMHLCVCRNRTVPST
jgi:SAM-dependent methyltransferase